MTLRFVVLLSCLASTFAHADSWFLAKSPRTIESGNRKFQATVTPAKPGQGATVVVSGRGTVRQPFVLGRISMPMDMLLLDDGSLFTLDTQAELGYGQVANLYSSTGQLRWSKTLVELIGEPLEDAAPHSTSSIWWRLGKPVVTQNGNALLITLFDENKLELSLKDGSTQIIPVDDLGSDPTKLVNRARSLMSHANQQTAVMDLLERALTSTPIHYDALTLYVGQLQKNSDHVGAVKVLERESARWKTYEGYGLANIFMMWAESAAALHRFANAERLLRAAIKAQPNYFNPSMQLAGLLLDKKQKRDAALVLDQYLSVVRAKDRLDVSELLNIAGFYEQRNELTQALAVASRGYKQDQVTDYYLYSHMAVLMEKLGRDADAIAINEQLLANVRAPGSTYQGYESMIAAELARLRSKK